MTATPAPTVAAVQTPPGAGGVAVVMLVGAEAERIIAEVFSPRSSAAPADDHLRLGELREGAARIDEAIVAVRNLPGDGGAAVEINVHGGPRVVQRVLQRLSAAGAKVLDDSGDLQHRAAPWPLAAEGLDNPAVGAELMDVLPHASTRFALVSLTRQWSDGISRLARNIVDGAAPPDAAQRLRAAAERLPAMKRLLAAPEVVLAGPPNAGKSSLANALLGRRACIVTDVAGTTRDWVREPADLGGGGVWLTDTAGLWAPDDPLDREAVERAWSRVDQADLVCAVFDAAAPPPADDEHWRRLLAEPSVLRIANKSDLAPAPPGAIPACSTADGLSELRRAILARLGLDVLAGGPPAAFTDRQATLLLVAADALPDTTPLLALLRG